MRVILSLAIVIGVFWAVDAYEYGGFYWTVMSNQFLHDADKFSHYVADLLTGHGG